MQNAQETGKPYLARRSNGTYEVRTTVRSGGRSNTTTVSLRTKDSLEAVKKFEGFMHQDVLERSLGSSPFVTDLLLSYESALESRQAGETAKICVRHLRRELAGVRLTHLTRERIQKYREDRRPATDPTVRRELSALVACINQAVKDRVITLADVPHIELPRQSQPKMTYMTEEQEVDFYQRALDLPSHDGRLTRIARYVAVGLDCAARKDAILGLTWDRIFLDGANPYIDFRVPGQPLHNKRRTAVPINPRLLPVLQRAKREKTTEYFLDHPGSIKRPWKSFVSATPYGWVTPHDLRRTFASLAVQAGVRFEDVAQVLCDSVEIVRRHYGHLDPRAKLTAVNHRWK